MSFWIAPEDEGTFLQGQMRYWRQVRESGGFDIEMPQGTTGLMSFYCDREDYPYSVQIKRYARFGLHRYNLIHGTNFQLHHLKKFNMTMNCLASCYITLASTTPALNFQVRVNESRRGRLNVTCVIARLQAVSEASQTQEIQDLSERIKVWLKEVSLFKEAYLDQVQTSDNFLEGEFLSDAV